MPRICYTPINFSPWKLDLIKKAIAIVGQYRDQGYDMTLRQVYYRFVAQNLFPERWADASGSTNNPKSYNNLKCLLSDARMAGLMDWEAMVDRTREMDGNHHWESPSAIIDAVAKQYLIDTWQGQAYRPQVWVEKDAMENIIGVICKRLDIPYFSCRGYSSLTALWGNAQDLVKIVKEEKAIPVVFHVGDHDPSGIDMSRNVEEQLRLFMGKSGRKLVFERLALNMDQIDEFAPPPNPVKFTDSRSKDYSETHGDECWELDALTPEQLDNIITTAVMEKADESKLEEIKERQAKEKKLLAAASTHWDRIAEELEQGMDAEEREENQDGGDDDSQTTDEE